MQFVEMGISIIIFYYLKYVVAVDDNIDRLKLLIGKYRGNL